MTPERPLESPREPWRGPRATCARCRRPESVCCCAHLTTLETKTRVVLLQHPRERDVPIGTARMASMCLPNAELHVGVHWRGSAALARALSDPSRPAVLLYPGEGATDVLASPPSGPRTLVVVDGTWAQTKKVVRENPELKALPRVAFTPPSPSEYRIRREPREDYVSTIEALAHVLGALEGDPERFLALLAPFRAMVDKQIACAETLKGSRHRRERRRRVPAPCRSRVPRSLHERADDLVCVTGEANAWRYDSAERRSGIADELVHWVARRVTTGETLDVIVAPRNPLAPHTPLHTRLAADALARGAAPAELDARWRAFVRETDVVCSWGRYATALFAARGGWLPEARVDLRQVARVVAGRKVGTLEEYLLGLGAAPPPFPVPGRAGLRLAQVVAIAESLRALAAESGAD